MTTMGGGSGGGETKIMSVTQTTINKCNIDNDDDCDSNGNDNGEEDESSDDELR